MFFGDWRMDHNKSILVLRDALYNKGLAIERIKNFCKKMQQDILDEQRRMDNLVAEYENIKSSIESLERLNQQGEMT